MKKRISVLLLTLLLVLSAVLPAYAKYGFVVYGNGEVPLLQEGDFEILTEEQTVTYETKSVAVRSEVEEAIYLGLKAMRSQINIYSYRINYQDIGYLLAKVINDNPDLFYVSSSYSYNMYSNDAEVIANVIPCYSLQQDEVEAATAVFDAGVEAALSRLDDGMTDLQKALVIHDYICDLAIYPVLKEKNEQGQYISTDKDIYHSAYGFFYDHKVVCAGYALAYSYLMNLSGVPCQYVTSRWLKHAWNKVMLDGHWYNVDCTWDNKNDDGEGYNTRGSVKHKFFLKSDDYFVSYNGCFHYDGTTYEECVADDTSYDNAFFNDVKSMIYVIDGDYYYLDPNYNWQNTTVTLTKRTADGTETALTEPILSGYVSDSDTGMERGENGKVKTIHTMMSYDALAKMTYLDNRLYFCAGENVYSYTLDGVLHEITPIEGKACGFGADRGNLIYQLYTGTKGENSNISILDKPQFFEEHMAISDNDSNYNNYPDVNYDKVVNAKDYALILQQ